MKTSIYWQVHNYCTGGCTYCPSNIWGGAEPRHVSEYIRVAKIVINHYKSLGRTINWTFDGGEPLEFFDFAEVLKLCKDNDGHISLRSNGGKLWMDWWAIEPNIDRLFLTYHYWQNESLINYIVQTFQKNNKFIEIRVPIRPEFFDDDFSRAENTAQRLGIKVHKDILYVNNHQYLGTHNYTKDQLSLLFGNKWTDDNFGVKKEFKDRITDAINSSPVYTGAYCNTGIDYLYITGDGWVRGSNCDNSPYGNIFNGNIELPTSPSVCKMLACTFTEDHKIKKF